MTLGTSPAASADLDSRDQIRHLVTGFYREVIFGDLLGPVFCDVAGVDWSVHIPKLVDYWCRVLLGQPGYDGPLLGPHRRVHEIDALHPELFDRWYNLFLAELDAGWRGPIADKAKAHAAHVAATLARRLLGADWAPRSAFR